MHDQRRILLALLVPSFLCGLTLAYGILTTKSVSHTRAYLLMATLLVVNPVVLICMKLIWSISLYFGLVVATVGVMNLARKRQANRITK